MGVHGSDSDNSARGDKGPPQVTVCVHISCGVSIGVTDMCVPSVPVHTDSSGRLMQGQVSSLPCIVLCW